MRLNCLGSSDVTKAKELISGAKNSLILGDKAYDSNALRNQIFIQKCIPVIPGVNSILKCII